MFKVGDIVSSIYDNKWRAIVTRVQVNDRGHLMVDGITLKDRVKFAQADASQFVLIHKKIKRNLPEWR